MSRPRRWGAPETTLTAQLPPLSVLRQIFPLSLTTTTLNPRANTPRSV